MLRAGVHANDAVLNALQKLDRAREQLNTALEDPGAALQNVTGVLAGLRVQLQVLLAAEPDLVRGSGASGIFGGGLSYSLPEPSDPAARARVARCLASEVFAGTREWEGVAARLERVVAAAAALGAAATAAGGHGGLYGKLKADAHVPPRLILFSGMERVLNGARSVSSWLARGTSLPPLAAATGSAAASAVAPGAGGRAVVNDDGAVDDEDEDMAEADEDADAEEAAEEDDAGGARGDAGVGGNAGAGAGAGADAGAGAR